MKQFSAARFWQVDSWFSVMLDTKSSVIYLLWMFFDPNDFEVTTNLKIASHSVIEETCHSFHCFETRGKKKKKSASSATPSSVCVESYRYLACYYGWWQKTTSQNVVSHLQSLSGDTSSLLFVGFFSKQHNEIIPFPSKMES